MQSFSSLNEKMRRGEKHPRLSRASDIQFFRVKNTIQAGGGPTGFCLVVPKQFAVGSSNVMSFSIII